MNSGQPALRADVRADVAGAAVVVSCRSPLACEGERFLVQQARMTLRDTSDVAVE